MTATSFDFVVLTLCGWVNRRQLASIACLREENRVLREQLGSKRPKLTDAQRRRLAKASAKRHQPRGPGGRSHAGSSVTLVA